MKSLAKFTQIVCILFFMFISFVWLILPAGGHNIPFKTNLFFGLLSLFSFILSVLVYFWRKKLNRAD
jgi:predicted Co/Zn/Cd cation transporter (cation efflux family)